MDHSLENRIRERAYEIWASQRSHCETIAGRDNELFWTEKFIFTTAHSAARVAA
jgi:Protein of unknown function (DUF2934)